MTSAYGQGGNSVVRTTTGTVKATGGVVWAIALDGVAAGSVELRDGGAGGTLRWRLAAGPSAVPVAISFPQSLAFLTDIHATIGGPTQASIAFD